MNFFSFKFSCSPEQSDILIAVLSENGFEGFLEEENFLTAYSTSEKNITEALIQKLAQIGIAIPKPELVPDKNWNEEWESKITPIEINNEVLIRTTFHSVEKHFPIEIIIEPKMSFGTGHHATTHMMVELMLMNRISFKGATVFDFGAGTGILSVMAEKLGSLEVQAMDHEHWAYENMLENFERNKTAKCIPILADQPVLESKKFDIILANINRNVILEFLPSLSNNLKPNGLLFCSGFLPEDEIAITQSAENLTLKFIDRKFQDNWMAMIFKKHFANS